MPPEIDETNGQSEETEATQDVIEQPPAAEARTVEKKVLTIPTSVMARIKQEERERGSKQALEKLNAEARALGFKNYEDLKAAAARAKARNASPVRTERPARDARTKRPGRDAEQEEVVETSSERDAARKQHPRYLAKLERQNQKLLEDRKKLNRAQAYEKKQRLALQRALDAKEAEMALRIAAVRSGVQDVDFAMHLLQQEVRGKSAEQLKNFDESKFFSNLRESRPYLFAVEERPASTGAPTKTAEGPAPKTAPKTPNAQEKGNGNGAIDAMKLTPQEFQKLLAERGYTSPNGSYRF
jgi:hypothetical protein